MGEKNHDLTPGSASVACKKSNVLHQVVWIIFPENTVLLGPKYKVVVRGYQLTRQQVTRNLRSLSVTPERRFEDLDPFVCEMWHSKHDVLEMCAVSYDMHCELLYQQGKKV